jgi:hypothetical protein
MRLKVFLIPYLCIISMSISSSEFKKMMKSFIGMSRKGKMMRSEKKKKEKKKENMSFASRLQYFFLIVVVLLLISQNYLSFKQYINEEKVFNHIQMEELLYWISNNTNTNDIIVSEMAVSSSISLFTDRIITNHPHFENEYLRKKTELVYKIFFCLPELEIYNILNLVSNNKVNYLVVATGACTQSNRIMINDSNQCLQKDKFCDLVSKGIYNKYFHITFRNSQYTLLRVGLE